MLCLASHITGPPPLTSSSVLAGDVIRVVTWAILKELVFWVSPMFTGDIHVIKLLFFSSQSVFLLQVSAKNLEG